MLAAGQGMSWDFDFAVPVATAEENISSALTSNTRRGMPASIDLNHATKEDLMEIPNFNVGRIRRLMQTRERLGGFKTWDDVKKAPGFRDGMVRRLQEAGFTLGSQAKAA
jgi:DNA uptake protein ComE-like DNA-binding protein